MYLSARWGSGQADWRWFDGAHVVGVTAGASAPETLIESLIEAIAQRFDVTLEEDPSARETVTFKLPRVLA